MKKLECDMMYENRAVLEMNAAAVHAGCGDCEEELVFAMKDNHHSFSICLRTILQCLFIAEREGNVPELPNEWKLAVINRHK